MPGFSELLEAFRALAIQDKIVIAHASLKKFGYIEGGPQTVIQAMRASFRGMVMPTFTYKTMIVPKVGPPENGITYGSKTDRNKMAEHFNLTMPPDKMMGILPATLLGEQGATRSSHPILSFGGINAKNILLTQNLLDPLAPIEALAENDGWVVLINVNHTVNTSIHYAEKLAGRKQFIRWALTPERIVECLGFPGDSSGFNEIDDHVQDITLRVDMEGGPYIQAIPLKRLVDVTVELIKKEPLALLCQREDCERCNAIRKGDSMSRSYFFIET